MAFKKWLYERIKVDGIWKLKHRYIMEQHLRRKLRQGEIIHHKNGNPKDNRIENLDLINPQKHNDIHHPKKSKIKCICEYCRKEYFIKPTIFRWKLKNNKRFFCSRSCISNGIWYFNKEEIERKKQTIHKCLKQGLIGSQIAKKYGWSKGSVYYHIRQQGPLV